MPSDELSSNDSAVIDEDLVQALGFEPAPDEEISVVEDNDAADLADEPVAAANDLVDDADLDNTILDGSGLDDTAVDDTALVADDGVTDMLSTDGDAQLASDLGFDAVVDNDGLELDLDAAPDADVEAVAEGMLDEVVEGDADLDPDDSANSGIASFFATRTDNDADAAQDDADIDLSSLPIVDHLAESDFDNVSDSELADDAGALDNEDVLDLDSVSDLDESDLDESVLDEAATDDTVISEITLDDLAVDDADFGDEVAELAPDEIDAVDVDVDVDVDIDAQTLGALPDEIDDLEVLDVDTADLDVEEPELFDQADDLLSTEPAPLIDLTSDVDSDAPTSFLDPVDVPDLDPIETPVGAPSPDGFGEESVDNGAVIANPTEVRKRGRGSRRQKQVRARKARRVVRHVDPWSVLTFSVLFHLCFFAAMLLASVLVWNAALASGTLENIENFITELGDYESFEINGDVVFRSAVIVAGMLTLASSVLVVLLTVVFNLISDLIGGIRITVIEEETVRVPAKSK